MALTQKGEHRYGDSQADIQEEIRSYSDHSVEHFADAVCSCGGRHFNLATDDTEGAALRKCVSCENDHAIGDSDEYLEDASLEVCSCICGGEAFEITAGVSLYKDSNDVRWFYLGCRCPTCGLTGVYGDWKNEFHDYRVLLTKI